MEDVEIPTPALPAARIDRAVSAQLGVRLDNPVNATDWRLYASVYGCLIYVALPEESRKRVVSKKVIAGLAAQRATLEAADREARKAKKQAGEAT
jgi:hypothetical protein